MDTDPVDKIIPIFVDLDELRYLRDLLGSINSHVAKKLIGKGAGPLGSNSLQLLAKGDVNYELYKRLNQGVEIYDPPVRIPSLKDMPKGK